ncbi:MAG: hypothetical protein JWN25_90 [Verrucomicrobiales bacterium]|nr:hypothetical protein [Verrucomicrobiales bacterium]
MGIASQSKSAYEFFLMFPRKTSFWFRQVSLRGVFWLFLLTSYCAKSAPLEDAEKEFFKGNYQDVIKTAQKEVVSGTYRSDWRMLLVKSLLITGEYERAYTNAANGLSDYSSNIGLRLLAREAALYKNDLVAATNRLEEIKSVIENRTRSYPTGDELVDLGRALLVLGVEPRLILENCFQKAEKESSPTRSAFLASGGLALEKHDYKLAADTFRAGLKKFPDDPDLNSGLAEAFENGNREEMLKAIDAALEVNPQHIKSLLMLADHLIDGEQYAEADKQLAAVLKVNPHQQEALAYRAILAHLRSDFEGEKNFRTEALKVYKTNPKVDYLIGHKLSQKYRFKEGAEAQNRALALDPDYFLSRRQLAQDLLRLGRDDEGWELAQSVHKQDAYDVTAYNLVTLYDQMVKFQTVSNADFTIHMSRHEAEMYGDRVLDLLNRAKATLTKKYGVELTQPTAVEIFPEQKDFAVRTFGMPGNPGYLGVCFGSVITANSPASQAPNPANWEAVLWHEFCHVVTLNATRNKMPRWLSEGISVYEERQANPTWGEPLTLDFRDMIMRGEATPLGKLSSAFLTPKNPQYLQFAYYESSVVVEFLVQKFGFGTITNILADLRDGQDINKSIVRRTTSLAEVEKQFTSYLKEKAENLAPGADIDSPPPGLKGDARLTWEKLHPKNYYVQMKRVEEAMHNKNWVEAKPLLESLAESYHGESRGMNPYWLLAVTQRNLQETNAEMATLQKFAAQESDFVDLFARLIELSKEKKDWGGVSQYAERLMAVNPLIPLPHRALAEASAAAGKPEPAIISYRKLLLLDPPDQSDVHFQLAKLLKAKPDGGAEAKRHALQALEEAPRFRDAQKLLLEIESAKPAPSLGTNLK